MTHFEAPCSTIVANGERSAQLGVATHDSPLDPGHIEARSSGRHTFRIRLAYCLLLCLSTPLFAIDRDRRIDQIQHTSWTAKEGAPGSIHAMAQTTEGYLWLGTDGGLVRFDGIHFDRYQPESGPPLPTHSVASLMAAPDGGLWIGFVHGGVSFLKDGRVTNYSEPDGLPANTVMKIARDRSGVIWAAAGRGGLRRLEGSRWRKIGTDWNLTGEAWGVFVDHSGVIWVSGGNKVFFLPAGSTKFQLLGDHLGYVIEIEQSLDGTIWMSDTLRSVRPAPLPGNNKHIPLPEIKVSSSAFMFDHSGCLWVTTLGDGIRRIPYPEHLNKLAVGELKAAGEVFNHNGGLTSDYQQAILEDREGNVWVGTNAGLDQFRQSPVVPVQLPSGAAFFTLVVGDEGVIWAASSNRPFMEIKDGAIVARRPQPDITSSYRDPSGNIWTAFEGKLQRFVNGRFQTLTGPAQTGPGVDGRAITMDRQGRIWMSVGGKGVFRLENGIWTSLESMGGPAGDAAAMFTDSLGRVWFGIGKTAVQLDDAKIQIFPQAQVTVGSVQAIQGDGPNIFVGGDSGLALFDGSTFRALTPEDAADFNGVSGVIVTRDDGLWLSESHGIIHIPQKEIEQYLHSQVYKVKYRIFGFLDGLPDPLQANFRLPSAVQATDGLFWFATNQGIVWIDPKRIPENLSQPPVLVQSIRVNGKSYSPLTHLHFPAQARDVQISYTALSLSIPERVHFRYRLEGVDQDWKDAGIRREAYYTNLDTGSYQFHVIACNNDGVWNDLGATIEFNIAPAWYQMIWFRILCAVVGAMVMWAIYHIRLRQVAAVMSARFDERLAERTRLARELHDTFLQTVQGSKMIADDALDADADQTRMRQALEKLSRWLGQAVDEGRAALHSLRVTTTEKNHLSEALRRATEDHQLPSSMTVAFSVIGDPKDLHPIVRDEVYRIGYEAIRNAAAHSRASRLEIDLRYANDLSLRVKDNGLGIDPSIPELGREGHFGLQGMRERASRIHSKFSIVSSMNAGTEVSLVVPGAVVYRNEHPSPLERLKEGIRRFFRSSKPDGI